MGVHPGLGWTFDTQAEKYARMRPGYPEALYEKIFSYGLPGMGKCAMEIGIGGGQATKPVLDAGYGVLAVEPGENFCQLCREKYGAYSGFSVLNGKFEDVLLDKEQFDLIFSASAFHWVPEEMGYKKVFDVLKKGGTFARFANHPNKDLGRPGMHEALQAVYAVYKPDSKPSPQYTEEMAKSRAEIALKYGFEDIEHHLFYRTRSFTAAEYTELLGTYSDHIAIEEKTRKKFFATIEDAINSLGGVITIYDTIDLQLARKPR